MKKNKLVNGFIIGTFVMLYILVSLISTIHVIDFFELSNPKGMSIALAVAFEVGAAASLASLITLDKMNKTLVWALFIAITAMQMQGNMYYAFMNLENFQTWSELFNLIEEEPLFQKRVLAFVSGAILPLVALGFIKSLVDYIKPDEEVKEIEEDVEAPGKLDSPEDEIDWDRFTDVSAYEDTIIKDFEFDNEDWGQLEEEELVLDIEESENMEELHEDLFGEEELVGEYFEQKAQQRENYETDELLNQEYEDEDLFEKEFDESHALDQVMNLMVEDEDLDAVVEAVENSESIDVLDLVNSKEANESKMPKKDLDASFQFGKNLYQTMVNKVNSDHLQTGAKPSREEITQAYKNLGLVNRDKK